MLYVGVEAGQSRKGGAGLIKIVVEMDAQTFIIISWIVIRAILTAIRSGTR